MTLKRENKTDNFFTTMITTEVTSTITKAAQMENNEERPIVNHISQFMIVIIPEKNENVILLEQENEENVIPVPSENEDHLPIEMLAENNMPHTPVQDEY